MYRFFLTRFDREAPQDFTPILLSSYDEAVETKRVLLGDKWVHGAFVNGEYLRDRWMKSGWLDETAAWKEQLVSEVLKSSMKRMNLEEIQAAIPNWEITEQDLLSAARKGVIKTGYKLPG